MAGSINPQDAANSIITVLTAGVPAQLAALDTAYDDGITLDGVDKYWRSPQEQYPGNVNVVVVPTSTETVNSPDQREINYISIEVIVTGSQSSATYTGTEMITIRLWRTCRAVQELVNKKTLSDAGDQCYVERIDASEIGTDGTQFEQRAEIQLQVFTS